MSSNVICANFTPQSFSLIFSIGAEHGLRGDLSVMVEGLSPLLAGHSSRDGQKHEEQQDGRDASLCF